MIRSYRDLEVWKKAMDLVIECYKITKKFPKTEIYGLTSQLQRVAVSIPSNIAEGHQRQHSKEFLQHLSIAYASIAELETDIEIAKRLNYINKDQSNNVFTKASEIARMINGLRKSITKRVQ